MSISTSMSATPSILRSARILSVYRTLTKMQTGSLGRRLSSHPATKRELNLQSSPQMSLWWLQVSSGPVTTHETELQSRGCLASTNLRSAWRQDRRKAVRPSQASACSHTIPTSSRARRKLQRLSQCHASRLRRGHWWHGASSTWTFSAGRLLADLTVWDPPITCPTSSSALAFMVPKPSPWVGRPPSLWVSCHYSPKQ